MTEEIKPLYYNQGRLIKTPQILYRTDMQGHRYYYSINDKGMCETFPSVTTILSKTMPTSEYLIKWIADYGKARADMLVRQKADYGTLLHICISGYLLQREFDPLTIKARINTFVQSNRIEYDAWKWWEKELINDMASFHAFATKHQITPIALEMMLSSKTLGFAGAIDAIVEMTVGSGKNGYDILKTDFIPEKATDKRKRIIALLDWKSGKKGFFPTHEAQLHMYSALWTEHYPNFKPDKLLNWAPTEWENEPTFKLKDQTDSLQAKQYPLYVEIFNNAEKTSVRKTVKQITGVLKLDDYGNNIQEIGFEEAVNKIHKIQKNEITLEKVITDKPVVAKLNPENNIAYLNNTQSTKEEDVVNVFDSLFNQEIKVG